MKFSGYSEIKKKEIEHFKCTKCEFLIGKWGLIKKNGKNVCSKCETPFSFDDCEIIPIKIEVCICNDCGTEVSITDENKTFYGYYICPSCLNTVNIVYENQNYIPQNILNKNFNQENIETGIKISDNLILTFVNDEKSISVLNLLNHIAKDEKTWFKCFNEDIQEAMLIYNDSEAMGYITWTENEEIILRQIFILPNFRKKGYATILIQEWINKFVKEKYDNFGVELSMDSPILDLMLKNNYFGYEKCFIAR